MVPLVPRSFRNRPWWKEIRILGPHPLLQTCALGDFLLFDCFRRRRLFRLRSDSSPTSVSSFDSGSGLWFYLRVSLVDSSMEWSFLRVVFPRWLSLFVFWLMHPSHAKAFSRKAHRSFLSQLISGLCVFATIYLREWGCSLSILIK